MPVEANRVAETATTTGTGTFTLGGALLKHQSFGTAYGTGGNTSVYYDIEMATGEWETGVGTYLGATNQLQRDIVLASSAGGSKVSFPAGSKTVHVPRPAETTQVFRARQPTDVPVQIRAAAGQTADLLEAYSAGGAKSVGLTASGVMTLTSVTALGNLTSAGSHIVATDGSSGFLIRDASGSERAFLYATGDSSVWRNSVDGNIAEQIQMVGDGSLVVSGNISMTPASAVRSNGWNATAATGGFNLQIGLLQLTNPSGSDTTSFLTNRTNGTLTFQARRDGNIYNANNVYAALSDERLKQNIGEAPSMTDLLMQIEVVRYRLASDPAGPWQVGVIAQQARPLLPDLVDEGEDGMLSFAYSKLTPRLLKMAQELAERVSALEEAII